MYDLVLSFLNMFDKGTDVISLLLSSFVVVTIFFMVISIISKSEKIHKYIRILYIFIGVVIVFVILYGVRISSDFSEVIQKVSKQNDRFEISNVKVYCPYNCIMETNEFTEVKPWGYGERVTEIKVNILSKSEEK